MTKTVEIYFEDLTPEPYFVHQCISVYTLSHLQDRFLPQNQVGSWRMLFEGVTVFNRL
jgi:hypothetical protein